MGHHHIGIVRLGAVDIDGEVVVLVDHFQPDGIAGVIAEAELRSLPRHGGIHAQLHIAGEESVVCTLHDLKISQQHCAVDRAGGLADAAAHLLHRLAVAVGRRLTEAALHGALTDGLVIVKYIAMVQNRAVDKLARELHIAPAGGAAGNIGREGGELITKQHRAEFLGSHLGIDHLSGQTDTLALGCGIHDILRRLHIHGNADLPFHDRAQLDVIPRGQCLGRDLVSHGLQVKGVSGNLRPAGLNSTRRATQLLHECRAVQLPSGDLLGGIQAILGKFIERIGTFGEEFVRHFVHDALQRRFIVREAG